MSSGYCFGRRMCRPKPRTGAHHVERGAAGAGVVARGRDERARADTADRGGELGLERGNVGDAERCADGRVRTLEEVVNDLHLGRAAAEARERVDEPLQPVLVLDDLVRWVLGERVRLVVDDERAIAVTVEHVVELCDATRERRRAV